MPRLTGTGPLLGGRMSWTVVVPWNGLGKLRSAGAEAVTPTEPGADVGPGLAGGVTRPAGTDGRRSRFVPRRDDDDRRCDDHDDPGNAFASQQCIQRMLDDGSTSQLKILFGFSHTHPLSGTRGGYNGPVVMIVFFILAIQVNRLKQSSPGAIK